MATRVGLHFHHPPLSLLILVVCCLGAEDIFIQEENMLKDVRQVACDHPLNGLVTLTVREDGVSSRNVVANPRRGSCVGNIPFHGCFINQTVVEVKVILTDLKEGQLRTFTCLASTESETGTATQTVGHMNVTQQAQASDSKSTSTASLDRPPISQEECAGDLTVGLTVVIVLTVIFCVIGIVLFVFYFTVKDQKVKPVNRCQSSRLPPPVLQAPDVGVKGLGMQYQIPDNLSSGGPLAQATGQDQVQGSLQYHEPWAQLDDEVSDRLAALRPNPHMCLVPGFQRPADVTEPSHHLKEEME